jgi:hypothetical protein
MELGDRMNEAKNELKRQDIVIEVRIGFNSAIAVLKDPLVHVQQDDGFIG